MKNTDNGLEGQLKENVTALYDIMRSEKIEELEIKNDAYSLHLKRKGARRPVSTMIAAPVAQAVEAAAQAVESAVEVAEAAISGETVKAPLMGVFYRAASPSSPPFVKEGDTVDAGRTLCIVEAMKVMNEVKAERRAKIVKILVENGKPITAGQDLFLVE